MSSLFVRVLRQARQTFDKRNLANFKMEFSLLKNLIDELTIGDLNMNPALISRSYFSTPEKAPCTYIHIFENDNVAMSIFILKENYTMPLHDHPCMHGILRGIGGDLEIRSYTEVSDSNMPINYNMRRKIIVKKEPMKQVNPNSESAVLTPTVGNFHEITAINGPAAFFDVLSPPYDADIPLYGPRNCTFYDKQKADSDDQLFKLNRIPTPSNYYCDPEPFSSPKLIKEVFQDSN